MNINLDPEGLRTFMRLWRDSLNNSIPMAPEFQLHFIQERPTILRNFERTASAWLMALRCATPAPADQEAFASIIRDIEAFAAWAKDELAALDRLAIETAIEAGIDDLRANHPDVLAHMAEFFRKKP